MNDISIIEAPADCETVTDIVVTDNAENQATVSWTASATANQGYLVVGYFEEADPMGNSTEFSESVGSGITTVATVDVMGLTADTSYDVYVISLCDSGNSAMSDTVNFVTADLGVNGKDLTKISFFPNPVKDELTITAGKSIDNIIVYNLLGQTVLKVQPSGTSVVVDMSALPTGIYVLKANVADAVSAFKVI